MQHYAFRLIVHMVGHSYLVRIKEALCLLKKVIAQHSAGLLKRFAPLPCKLGYVRIAAIYPYAIEIAEVMHKLGVLPGLLAAYTVIKMRGAQAEAQLS